MEVCFSSQSRRLMYISVHIERFSYKPHKSLRKKPTIIAIMRLGTKRNSICETQLEYYREFQRSICHRAYVLSPIYKAFKGFGAEISGILCLTHNRHEY